MSPAALLAPVLGLGLLRGLLAVSLVGGRRCAGGTGRFLCNGFGRAGLKHPGLDFPGRRRCPVPDCLAQNSRKLLPIFHPVNGDKGMLLFLHSSVNQAKDKAASTKSADLTVADMPMAGKTETEFAQADMWALPMSILHLYRV